MKRHRPRHLVSLSLLGGIALSLLFVALPLRAQEPPEQEPGWSEPVSLSENFPQSYLPDIAADQAGNLYVVWAAQFTDRSEGWADGIGFAMWDGNTWSRATDIFGQEMHHLPSIAVDSQGRLHLIGVGRIGLGYSRAWGQERPADARAWSEPVDISDEYPHVYWNDMVVDSRDWIHVVFSDQAPGDDRQGADGQCVGEDCSWVFYTRSTDGGDSWSVPAKISPAMMSGARVMIAVDKDDNLYVVWSTEFHVQGADFFPSANGFVYLLEGNTTWSEPESQVLDTGGADAHKDFWLSVAVDSRGTVHVVTVGSGIRHLHKQDLEGPWQEEAVPRLNVEGLGPGYGFRGIAVDSDDQLHFVLPAYQPPGSEALPGLFHTVWTRGTGWSDWSRATTNARGKGCGLGNVVVSGGNQLNVVWFEHLEASSGHLFLVPRGRIEIYYASLQTEGQPVSLRPLPSLPTLAVAVTSTEQIPAPVATDGVTPGVTGSPTALTMTDPPPSTSAAVNEWVVGIGTTVLVMTIAVGVVVLRRRR